MKKFFKALACLASLALLAGAFVSCSDDPDDETPAVTYTITYQTAQATANKPADKTVVAGYKLTAEDLPALTADGYTFGKWHNGSESGAEVAVGFEVTANLTLVAKWTAASSGSDSDDGNDTSPEGTYAITTSGITNGTVTVTVGETAASSAAEGATVTLTVTASTGYTFSGTPTVTADGESVTVTAVDGHTNQFTFTMPAKAVTVAATFTAKTSTVSFSLSDGTGTAPSDVTATYGQAMPELTFTAPAKTGNTFGGFVDDNGTKYYAADGKSAKTWDKEDAEVQLKAVWIPDGEHGITINISGGHGSGAATVNNSTVNSAAENASVTVTFTPDTGYKTPDLTSNAPTGVTNWAKSSDNVYTFTMGADAVTISVTFEAVEYTITYKDNSADFNAWKLGYDAPTSYTVENRSSITLPTADNIEKEGYTFTKWQKDGSDYAALENSAAENIELTAVWEAKSYSITYKDGDGDINDLTPTSYTYSATGTTTLAASATKEGYNFVGWYESKDSQTGDAITAVAAGTTGDKTYYAKWTEKEYTVTFYSDGGSEVAAQTVKYGGKATEPNPAPTKTGNAFTKWQKTDSTGFSFDTAITENIELKAVWEAITLTIKAADTEIEDSYEWGAPEDNDATDELALTATANDGATVAWSVTTDNDGESDLVEISDDGKLSFKESKERPAEDTTVKVTATATKGGGSKSITVSIVIKAKDSSD